MKKGLQLLLILFLFILLAVLKPVCAENDIDFELPSWGGSMVHCDPYMTDYIKLEPPRENVEVIWHQTGLSGELAGAKGNGIAGNGEIAVCAFSGTIDNLIVYDYDGNRVWSSGDLLNAYTFFSVPIIDVHNRIIACDNKIVTLIDIYDYDSDGLIVEWTSEIPYGGLPFSPVITEDGTIIVATYSGPIYAYNITDGSLIAHKYLGEGEILHPLQKILRIGPGGFFSTINTPCVNGNRFYISTEYKGFLSLASLFHYARLYAIDVESDNPVMEERIKVAWYYEFGGPSQASPLFHDNTIYFDGYRPGPQLLRDIHLFAVEDKGDHGEEKWKVPYPLQTYASFTLDPRGGFWYVNPLGGNLVRFSMDDGSIIEEIFLDGLVNETGIHIPSSVMTMCGSTSHPVLLVSASCLQPLKTSSYVLAIDLAADNSVIWKIKIYSGLLLGIDLEFGQYTILTKNNDSRVVFGTFKNGVWAVGTPEII